MNTKLGFLLFLLGILVFWVLLGLVAAPFFLTLFSAPINWTPVLGILFAAFFLFCWYTK